MVLNPNRHIDLNASPCNVLIQGTARTGKTYVAIELIKKLLKAQIPVTLIENTHNPHSVHSDYADLFTENSGIYRDLRCGDELVGDNLLFGIGLQETSDRLIDISDNKILSFLHQRVTSFDKSFVFVDEIDTIRPFVKDLLNKFLANGAKEGISNVHIFAQTVKDIDFTNYNRLILLQRPIGGFSASDLEVRKKMWAL